MNENDIGGLYFVSPGWWALLDRELPKLYEIDPQLSGVLVEEKYGRTRLRYDDRDIDRAEQLSVQEMLLEQKASQTCELCGQTGSIRSEDGWIYCRCDRCHNATHTERRQIERTTAAEYQTVLGQVAAQLPKGIVLTEREAAAIRYGIQYPGELEAIMCAIKAKERPTGPSS